MKLPAEIAEAPLEVLRVETEPPRHTEEAEEITVPSERKDPVALGTEVLVDRGAGAAVAALERRRGTEGIESGVIGSRGLSRGASCAEGAAAAAGLLRVRVVEDEPLW